MPVPQRKGEPVLVTRDEHPRETSAESLAGLRPLFAGGSVTAGNSSGINDGAAALLVASGQAVERYGLQPLARIISTASAGVQPRVMGIGPVPAVQRLLGRTGVKLDQVGTIELNEAFASQSLAVLRALGLADDAPHVNPHGGAIALGHPLGMSGARLALTAAQTLADEGLDYAIATLCVGVGQGVAMLLGRPEAPAPPRRASGRPICDRQAGATRTGSADGPGPVPRCGPGRRGSPPARPAGTCPGAVVERSR